MGMPGSTVLLSSIAFLGLIFMENFCLVTRLIHECEGCVLYTWEWPRAASSVAANIITDRNRTL